MFALIFITTLLLLCLIKKLRDYRNFTSKLDIFIQFKGLPLIGIAHKMYDVNKAVYTCYDYFKQCETSHVLYLGPIPYLMVSDPELAEVVLSSNILIEKNNEYQKLKLWFGDGLLTSTGEKWKSHRKILTPSFHYSILEDFVQVFDKHSKILVNELQNEVEEDNLSIDIYKYLTLCTLDIICETAMGTEINVQENPNTAFVQSVKDMCYIMFLKCVTPLRIGWLYRLTEHPKTELNAVKVLRDFSETIIKNRRKVLESKEQQPTLTDIGMKSEHSFLDVLLQANVNGRKLTDEEVREEVDTFMFEDTTGVALSFAIFMLSKHPDVQKKVYEEILEVIGPDREKSVTMAELNQLKYTQMVIKESLRLYPSVIDFGRNVTQDTPYKNGVIPKGLQVVINTYNLHHHPKTFPDPEKFDPERFSLENSLKRHPYGYVPFSAGPRNCIGQKFAMLELKSTITKVLRFYEVLPAIPDHKLHIISVITIQSSTGIKIRLKNRE